MSLTFDSSGRTVLVTGAAQGGMVAAVRDARYITGTVLAVDCGMAM